MKLTDVLRAHAADRPDRTAYVCGDERVTFAELDARVDRTALALRASGVRAGDRVAILDKNSLEYVELMLGAARIGAVLVPVNYRLAPDEVAYIVGNARAVVLVAGAEFAPVLDAIAGRLEHTRRLLVIGAGDGPYDDYAGWRDTQRPEAVDEPGEVFVQLYSSGTTGLPKGAMLTHANFTELMPTAGDIWGLGPDSVFMVAMPMYHIAGCGTAMLILYSGVTGVIVREPDPVTIVTTLAAERVTHVFLVPVLLLVMQQIPQAREADLSALKLLVYGASPISEEVLAGAMRLLPRTRFMQVYGLTETTGAITFLTHDDHVPPRLRSAGRPGPGVELRIADPAIGEELPTGEVGEIMARTPQNMLGYWSMEQATKETLVDEGWLRTGDIGYLDADGYLYINDRVKDMIISGGENIYPAEVENVLMGHPAVADCAVIGVPDPKWGETPKAVVVRATGAETDGRELIDHCRERLAHFKCPTSVDFVDAVPRNPTGKILKRELREPYWRDQAREVH